MNFKNHPWEEIYCRNGRVFTEPFQAFSSVAQKFIQNQSSRILDLGCGNGRHVVALMNLTIETVGLDISPTGLDLTREWLNENELSASLVCGDMRQNLPFMPGIFDGLISTQVIHHALLAEIRHTISEIWRVMITGGIAFITVAGKKHEDISYKEIEPGTYLPLEGTEKGLPHHIFNEEELCREFKNFQIQDVGPRDEGRVLSIWLKKVV
ncbi:MAG: class I SAM-dependent methyltransferase [Anaerolineales bacterium]